MRKIIDCANLEGEFKFMAKADIIRIELEKGF